MKRPDPFRLILLLAAAALVWLVVSFPRAGWIGGVP